MAAQALMGDPRHPLSTTNPNGLKSRASAICLELVAKRAIVCRFGLIGADDSAIEHPGVILWQDVRPLQNLVAPGQGGQFVVDRMNGTHSPASQCYLPSEITWK